MQLKTMPLIKRFLLLIALCLCANSNWAKPAAVSPSTNGINENLTKNLDELVANLKTSIGTLTTQTKAERVIVKKRALQSGLDALNQLYDSSVELQTKLGEVNTNLGQSSPSKQTDALQQLNDWRAAQLKRVDKGTDGLGLPEARDILNEFVFRYTTNLQGCQSGSNTVKKDFEYLLKTTINVYQSNTDKLINEMQLCGKASRSSDRCRFGIEDAAERILYAPDDLYVLVRNSGQLTDANDYDSQCSDQILEELKEAQKKVEDDLTTIIEDNPSATLPDEEETTPTVAPSSGTSPQGPASPTPGANTPAPGSPTPGSPTPGANTPAPGSPTPGATTPAPGSPAPGSPTPGATTPAPGSPAPGATTPAPGSPTPGATTPAPGSPAPGGDSTST